MKQRKVVYLICVNLLKIAQEPQIPANKYANIYNRVHLENATDPGLLLRAPLAKFGAMVDALKVLDRTNTLSQHNLGVMVKVVEKLIETQRLCLFGDLDIPLVNMETSFEKFMSLLKSLLILNSSSPSRLLRRKPQAKSQLVLVLPPAGPPSTADAYERLLSSSSRDFGTLGSFSSPSAPVELKQKQKQNMQLMLLNTYVIGMWCSSTTAPTRFLRQFRENVTVIVDSSDADNFARVASKPLPSLPYDTPGLTVEYHPTGEAERSPMALKMNTNWRTLRSESPNFRNAWVSMGDDFEQVDEYVALAQGITWLKPLSLSSTFLACSLVRGCCKPIQGHYTCLLSGVFLGNVRVLVRFQFGIHGSRMICNETWAVRSEDEAV
ncbi:hypothetical protein NC651_023311 [Populus alba x Populus x berolinensis]|nr:hypothetical protein NC651_023311 [Populus alba x Populus x berolinensis]